MYMLVYAQDFHTFLYSLSLSLSLSLSFLPSYSYGNSLVLVASQELRERSLVPVTQSPPGDINDVQYCLLEVVGCSRHYGTCRPYITNKYFKIDARSLYHHSKELKKHGLVVIKVGSKVIVQCSCMYRHVYMR